MIYLTGDLHGDIDRLSAGRYAELDRLTKDDCVIVCGDFGCVWDDSPEERRRLDRLDARPFTTLFVTGNHENFELLSTFPVTQWHGGSVQAVRPSVIHLMRGQIYELEGKRFFTMGGASSHDIQDGILEPDDPNFQKKLRELRRRGAFFRVDHRSWWKEELPSQAEYQQARENLEKAGWEVDYIVTHCAPTSVQNLVSTFYEADALTDFLQEVKRRCAFKVWFFGHYHQDAVVEDRLLLLYRAIMPLLDED